MQCEYIKHMDVGEAAHAQPGYQVSFSEYLPLVEPVPPL